MADQRAVDVGDTLVSVESKAVRKAKIASVLARGITTVNLDTSFLGDDRYGQWVPDNSQEVSRLKSMGFEVFHGEHPNKLHSASDGTVRVGDVLLMVASKETKELIDEVMRDRSNAVHNPSKGQVEERSFKQSVDGGIVPIVQSTVEEVDANHIMAATKKE